MKGLFMEKSLKKDIIINRLPVVIYFILIFAALMVIISAVAPMSNQRRQKSAYITI